MPTMPTIEFWSGIAEIEKVIAMIMHSLIEKRQGAVLLASSEMLDYWDKQLWYKPQLGFMPHALIKKPINDDDVPLWRTPLLISDAQETAWQADIKSTAHPLYFQHPLAEAPINRTVLINVGGESSFILAHFDAVYELIPAKHLNFGAMLSDTLIVSGRHRFSRYRHEGYTIHHRDFSKEIDSKAPDDDKTEENVE